MRMKKEVYWDLLLNLSESGSYGLLHETKQFHIRF